MTARQSAAHRFVQVFELFKSPNLGDLTGLTIDASSLYRIAARPGGNCPEIGTV